jgi:hypothetical protein
MVAMIAAEEMTIRATAKVLGIGVATVHRDLEPTVPNGTVDGSRTSHGLDGRTRTHEPRAEPPAEPERDVTKELGVINDIRLYFNAIASSRQVAGLTPKGKQHVIDAALGPCRDTLTVVRASVKGAPT